MSDTQPSRPWKWPGEWAKDEKFWRDVGSRALAGLIVVILTWLGAVALGYLQEPQFVHGLGNVILLVAIVLVVLLVPLQISHALRLRRQRNDRWKAWAWSVVSDVMAIPVLVIFLATTWAY